MNADNSKCPAWPSFELKWRCHIPTASCRYNNLQNTELLTTFSQLRYYLEMSASSNYCFFNSTVLTYRNLFSTLCQFNGIFYSKNK